MACCKRQPVVAKYAPQTTPAPGSGKEGADLASIVLEITIPKGWDGKEESLEFQRTIVPLLYEAELNVRAFFGVEDLDGTKRVYLQVSATADRLRQEAVRTRFMLRLHGGELAIADEAANKVLATKGVVFAETGNSDVENFDVHIPRAEPLLPCRVFNSTMDPYERIWAPYVSAAPQSLYYVNEHTGGLFSETQALKLLISIMQADRTDRGAGLKLNSLQNRKKIVRWFPAHNPAGIAKMTSIWADSFRAPWAVPIDAVKNYFGERVAFYFAFLGHFAQWIIVPAIVGFGIFIHQRRLDQTGVDYLPAYGIAVALWATVFMEFWKRRQNQLAQRWGMMAFETQEQMRPQYKSAPKRSLVHGKLVKYVSPTVYRLKNTLSGSLTLTALGIVVVVVGSIFILRVTLKRNIPPRDTFNSNLPDYITSVINAVQIQIMNFLYTFMAYALTNWENHRTQTQYDNSLTLKLAVFQTLNTYFGLVYIAAIKTNITIRGEPQTCAGGDCMNELGSQLAILMLTRLVISIVKEFVLPLMLRWIVPCFRRCTIRDPERRARYEAILAAKQASPLEYQSTLGTFAPFDDYLEVMLQFGFCSLFVVAFPLAPLVALISVFLSLYIDRARMCKMTARPVPEGAQDIGAWMLVFEFLAYGSAISNLTIVVFTNKARIFDADWDYGQRLLFFIICEHVLLIVKFFVASYIPDLTSDTALQLERQSYLVDKHIFKQPEPGVNGAAQSDDAAVVGAGGDTGAGGSGLSAVPSIRGSNPIRGTSVGATVDIRSSWFNMTSTRDPREATPAANTMRTATIRGGALGSDPMSGAVVVPNAVSAAVSPSGGDASAGAGAMPTTYGTTGGGGYMGVPVTVVAGMPTNAAGSAV